MAEKIHVLMTGAGAPGGAGILKCLGQESAWKITVADLNPDLAGRYGRENFEQVPPAIAPLFIPTLLELCKGKKINAILPLVTKELLPLSRHRALFEKEGIRVPVSNTESLEIAVNKSRTYEFLDWRGIKVPAFRIVETTEQFESAVYGLGYPENPVCFKPSLSNGSRGFRVITEHINESDLLFNYKPDNTFMRMADAVRILRSAPIPELLVTEYLPGEEYSVDCLAFQGETVIAVPRLRKKTVNGISVEGEFREDATIITYCRSVISALRLHGNIGIQVKRSSAGEALILEINPRVQGTISACLGAGINLPVLALKQEMGEKIDGGQFKIKWGTRFSRHWEEVFYQDDSKSGN